MSFQNTPVFPRICVGPAQAIYIGPGLKLAPHLNLTTTIAVSLAGSLLLRTWTRSQGWSEWQSSTVALIPPKTLHHLVSDGNMAFLYCDPLVQGRSKVSQAQLFGGRELLLREAHAVDINRHLRLLGCSAQDLRTSGSPGSCSRLNADQMTFQACKLQQPSPAFRHQDFAPALLMSWGYRIGVFVYGEEWPPQ